MATSICCASWRACNLREAVPPVQLAIRLLVPQGSYLLHLPGFAEMLEPSTPTLLGYPWRHADARVDALQQRGAGCRHANGRRSRAEAFARDLAARARRRRPRAPRLDGADPGNPSRACPSRGIAAPSPPISSCNRSDMPRVLLLLPAAGYRNEDFLSAAQQLDVEVITAADHCHRLAPLMGMSPILSLPFDQPEIAAEQALVSLGRSVDAVLAVDDHGLELAALLRKKLGLAGNPLQAVRATRDKLAFRQLQQMNGLQLSGFPGRRQRSRCVGSRVVIAISRRGESPALVRQPGRRPRR